MIRKLRFAEITSILFHYLTSNGFILQNIFNGVLISEHVQFDSVQKITSVQTVEMHINVIIVKI